MHIGKKQFYSMPSGGLALSIAARNIACRFIYRILHTRAMIRASRRLPTGADAEW